MSQKVISKVYEGTSGEGQYGPWTAYNFYVEDDDKRYSKFWGEGKPKPVEGMILNSLEYTVKESGEYTNYNVKKLDVDHRLDTPEDESTINPTPTPAKEEKTPERAAQAVKSPKNGNSTSIQVALNGLFHGAAGIAQVLPEGSTPVDLAKACIVIYLKFKDFADNFREDMYQVEMRLLKSKIDTEAFWDWVCEIYKREEKEDLSPKQSAHLLTNFDGAVEKYHQSEETEQVSQDDKAQDETPDQTFEEVINESGYAVVPDGPIERTEAPPF